jgi:hypothetical protein
VISGPWSAFSLGVDRFWNRLHKSGLEGAHFSRLPKKVHKSGFVSGREFTRAARCPTKLWASAPEGCFYLAPMIYATSFQRKEIRQKQG